MEGHASKGVTNPTAAAAARGISQSLYQRVTAFTRPKVSEGISFDVSSSQEEMTQTISILEMSPENNKQYMSPNE